MKLDFENLHFVLGLVAVAGWIAGVCIIVHFVMKFW